MICEACRKAIDAYPCACGYDPKALQIKPQWIIQECSTPGCFTVIRSKAGAQQDIPLCQWCLAGESHAMLGKPAVDTRLREHAPT
jgi:hypothetical protein